MANQKEWSNKRARSPSVRLRTKVLYVMVESAAAARAHSHAPYGRAHCTLIWRALDVQLGKHERGAQGAGPRDTAAGKKRGELIDDCYSFDRK